MRVWGFEALGVLGFRVEGFERGFRASGFWVVGLFKVSWCCVRQDFGVLCYPKVP